MSAPAATSSSAAPAQNAQAASAARSGQPGARRAGEPAIDNSLFAHLLLLLGDAAEPLYAFLGYKTVGVIPGYSREPAGSGFDATTVMYKAI
jgi:hypothetical protein